MKLTYLYSQNEKRLMGKFPTRQEAATFAKHFALRKYDAHNVQRQRNKFLYLTEETILKYISKTDIDNFDLIDLLNKFPLMLIRSHRNEHLVEIKKQQSLIVSYLENINSFSLYQLILPHLTYDGKRSLEYCTGLWENTSYLCNEKVELIFNVVSKIYSIDVLSFKNSPRRQHVIIKPRFCAMWLLKKKTTLSLKAIGSLFFGKSGNGYDHSTVYNGIGTYQDLLDTDRETRAVHKQVIDLLDYELTKIDARLLLS